MTNYFDIRFIELSKKIDDLISDVDILLRTHDQNQALRNLRIQLHSDLHTLADAIGTNVVDCTCGNYNPSC